MIPFILLLLNSLLSFVESGKGEFRVEATGVSPEAQLSLHRVTASTGGTEGPPLFATVSRDKGKITLVPTFDLSPGETYRAHLTVGGTIIERADYQKKISDKAAPQVVRILPDNGIVPANLLKFYLEFSQPIREGREIFDQIHIVDLATGKKVHSPWRRQELWSEDQKRLTLWIHPGRVKQGVNLRQQLGPVLLPGKKYELVLDSSIRSPEGKTLAKEFRHPFATTDEDRSLVDVDSWKISPPRAGQGTWLIQTDRPLDPFLATRHIEIKCEGETVPSPCSWDKSQTRFEFVGEWKPGKYQLTVGEYLEDLAGNTAVRIFDTDLSLEPTRQAKLEREFLIGEEL